MPGYTGKNCKTDFDECASNPCKFNGICTDRINAYHCACVNGFRGTNCQVNKTARLTLMIVHPILVTMGEFVTMIEVPSPAIVPKDLLVLDVKGTSMTVRTTIV